MRWAAALTVALFALVAFPRAGLAKSGMVAGLGIDAQGRATVLIDTTRSSRPVLLRFAADGRLDDGFGRAGVLRPQLAGATTSLAVEGDGATIVGGNRGRKVVLLRYRQNGTRDRRFGGSGAALVTYGGPLEDVLLQPGGQIVALGTQTCAPEQCGFVYRNLQVRRFDPAGRLLHDYRLSKEYWFLQGVGLEAGGGFVVAGFVGDLEYETYDRFGPSGAYAGPLRGGFSQVLKSGEREEEVQPQVGDLAVDQHGKLLIATTIGPELWLWDRRGRPVESFGNGGRALCGVQAQGGTFAPGPPFSALLVAPDDEILAAGGAGECGLVRYLEDGRPDPTFGADGSVDVEAAGAPRPEALSLLPDGRILVAGRDPTTGRLALARFSAAGALDPSFGVGGVASQVVRVGG